MRRHALRLACLVFVLAAFTGTAAPRPYSIVLVGTVQTVGGSSVDVVAPSTNTITVAVLRVLMPSWQTVLSEHDVITAQLDAPAAFVPGDAVLVFGDGWIYANNIALRAFVRAATKSALENTLAAIEKSDNPEFDSEDAEPVSLASAPEAPAPNAFVMTAGFQQPPVEPASSQSSVTEVAIERAPATISLADLDAMQQTLEMADLRKRVRKADVIIQGEITKIGPLSEKNRRLLQSRLPAGREESISEHDTEWGEAVIKVTSILKGVQARKIVVLYPQKSDIRWTFGPQYLRGQHGVFLLQEPQILAMELPDGVTNMAITNEPAVSLDSRDYLSADYVKRVREIVAEPKQK